VETDGSLEEVLLGIDQCPTCSKNLEILESWQDEVGYPCLAVVADERNRAVELWQNLEGRTTEELPEELGKEYRFWAMCRLLGEKANKETHFSATRAVRLAQLAVDLSQHLDASYYSPRLLQDLQALVLAILGFSLKAAGNFCAAQKSFDDALERLERGSGSSLVRARVLFFHGGFLKDQLRLDEALTTLEEAALLFELCGNVDFVIRSHLFLALVEDFQGDLQAAIARITRAQSLIRPESDPTLLPFCQHQLLHLLTEAGCYEEASLRLDLVRGMQGEVVTGANRMRLAWVEARISRGSGLYNEAEELLLGLERGFSAAGRPVEVGIIQLDLASVYVAQGRFQDAARACQEAHLLLSSSGASKQALAALNASLAAVKSQEVTMDLLTQLVLYVSVPALQARGRFSVA
jgi:tetratricopeptide (TPR) repeat protein